MACRHPPRGQNHLLAGLASALGRLPAQLLCVIKLPAKGHSSDFLQNFHL